MTSKIPSPRVVGRWLYALPRKIARGRGLVSYDDINHHEHGLFSQNGEDGVLKELFFRIGATNRCFAEFGVEDGSECISALFAQRHGWSGLMIEGDPDKSRRLAERYCAFPNVKTRCAFITRENIRGIFAEAGVRKDVDLLCIDIDGNDYWIWRELRDYRARVVVIEYNANIPATRRWVMQYKATHIWRRDTYFGASLTSLASLGKELGYALVGTNRHGINAFFVRNDLLELARFPELTPAEAYHKPSRVFGLFGLRRGFGPYEEL